MKSEELNQKILDYMKEALGAGIRDVSFSKIAALFLKLDECCGDIKHRIQPDSATDWRAVDNMVGLLVSNLCEHVADTIHLLRATTEIILNDNIDEDVQLNKLRGNQIGIDLSRNFLNCQAIMVREHYRIVSEYDRVDGGIDADAREHYKLILKNIQEAEKAYEETKHGSGKEERGSADRCSIRSRSTYIPDSKRTH